MKEGGDQTSPAVQQIREGEDPDIGPPATHIAETELQHGQAEGGTDHGQGQTEGGSDQGQKRGSREIWSFSPPRTWTKRPSRPLTQSVAGRRQRERDRVQHTAERIIICIICKMCAGRREYCADVMSHNNNLFSD